MELANKYKRDIDEVHKIYFDVSCQRDLLLQILSNGTKLKSKWSDLEDVALAENPPGQLYK